MIEEELKELKEIKKLEELYKDSPYMLKRLNFHLTTILPKTLQHELQNWEKRKERNKDLQMKQQIFIQVFLSNHQYFYLNNTNTFYEYDGINYKTIKEDDILYQVLSSLSKDKSLIDWKYKTKFQILKQIKERTLFQSIPETITIQHVVNNLTPLFSNKQEVKYFLTILGDNILKKNMDLIFLVKPKTKKLLHYLDNLTNSLINVSNITSNIITKYHESYQFDKCRLLKIHNVELAQDIFKRLALDLLCIATYYSSNRYTNSDNYINNVANPELKTYSLFLKNNTSKTIVESFCKYALESNQEPTSNKELLLQGGCDLPPLSWKNMHYIWKLYISKNGLPNILYSNNLKNMLIEQGLQYDELTDTFYNVTSKYLPRVSDFLQFWEETITLNNTANNQLVFEIDELTDLFKKWTNSNNNSFSNGHVSEHDVVKIMNHFYPNIDIANGLNIHCSLWNKTIDITGAIDSLKELNKNNETLILIEDVYKYYLKYCRKNKCAMVVNKRYFEIWTQLNLNDIIVFDKFIQFYKG
jgi:hypothetical protein